MRRLAVTAPPDTSAPWRSWIPAPRRSSEGIPIPRPPCPPVVRRGLTVTGFGIAAVFYCLSFTPSLLPRPYFLQGVVAGITAATGYAVGTTAGALARLVRRPGDRVVRVAWRALFVLVPPMILIFLWLSTRWQRQLRL